MRLRFEDDQPRRSIQKGVRFLRQMPCTPVCIREKRHRRKVLQRQKHHILRNGGQRKWPICRKLSKYDIMVAIAPSVICISDDEYTRKSTIEFCSRARSIVLNSKSNLVLDFSKTRKIFADGMLLVMSEIDRCKRMSDPNQVISCKLPESNCSDTKNIRDVLYQVGMLDLVNHDTSFVDKTTFRDDVRHWKFITGTTLGESHADLLYKEADGVVDSKVVKDMYAGLVEALTNSRHHAYKGSRQDLCREFKEKRWWMFAERKVESLSILVCDLGIGIRRSLPTFLRRQEEDLPAKKMVKLLKEVNRRMGRGDPDVAAMRIALKMGNSSTGKVYRGRGLPQIWNATRQSEGGAITILSGYGLLRYDGGNGVEHGLQFSSTMLGTIVSWSVPINAVAETVDG